MAIGDLMEGYEDQQDAKRYRWLRDKRGGGHAVVCGDLLEGKELDELCDRYLAADTGVE